MIRRFFLAILLSCLWLETAWADTPPRVVVSIKPIHSLLAGLMRGLGEPRLLVTGTKLPWEYQLDDDARRALAEADLLVWSGKELEPALGRALSGIEEGPRVLEVLASDDLKILPLRTDDSRRDAYFWLDSRNILILLDELTRALAQLDPDQALSYYANRIRVLESVADIDRKMEFGYRDVSGVPVFMYHDTHQYFEQAYAVKVVGTVTDPQARDGVATGLLRLKHWLSEAPNHCLFTETGLPVPHLDLLLNGTDITPLELDSLGLGLQAGPGLYVELMQRNFATISRCVRAVKPQTRISRSQPVDEPDERRFKQRIDPRYLLMNQYGQTVTNEDFRGRFQLIYFGYTFCPDICPTGLASMAHTLVLLGEDAQQVQPIFITVDPARDTPDVLKRYAAYFHPRLLGLTGSPALIKRTAENFKARYEKALAEGGDPDIYSMDHTASQYLLGPDGAFITKFAHGMPAEQVAERIREYMEP